MKFKVVGKRLILTDCSHEITEGENSFDAVKVTVPRRHDNCDLSVLSFRFSEISEDGKNSAVQVLCQENCDENYVYLRGEITSDFSSITGKVIFMLTGVNGENVVAKFISSPYTINDDISLMSLPDNTTAEQLFNQAQLEAQKAINAAEAAHKMLEEFTFPVASEAALGGIISGGDVSVSKNGSVTVQSVNGKTIEKSVPTDAIFTDTVYTLPKATKGTLGGVKVDGTSIIADKNGVISAVGGKNSSGQIILPIASYETLGGVKVDGKTIAATEDGTISVLGDESIKAEIVDIKSSQNSISNLAVQIAHPNNFLIYDDVGKPSVMVAIPKFYLDEVIDGASHTIHPAFIINGVEQEVIYISKYQNTVENERAYSLPMKSPITNVTFDTAWNYCKNKGAGWHLMTNAEWAAVELWCKKNNIFPKGNNDYGKDISETNLPSKAMAASYDSSKNVNKTLTGSGQENWYHDGTFAGIADLNGNVWEWNSGMRLINGKIQILENNDAADYNNSVFADSALWKEIMPDGSLVAPGTTGTLAYSKSYGSALFTNLTTTPYAAGTGAALLEVLGLLPHENSNPADYGNNAVWITVEGEKVPLRGGAWYSTTLAGIFTLMLGYERSYNNVVNGFRCAYYGSIA